MRAALALYAIRFGGWLLAKATPGHYVYIAVEIYDGPDDAPIRLEREYAA